MTSDVEWLADDRIRVGSERFVLTGAGRFRSDATAWCLRKVRPNVERLLELRDDFLGANVVEFGIDQGGSVALLQQLLSPRSLAIDINDGHDYLEAWAAGLGDDGPRLAFSVSQDDVETVTGLLDETFGVAPLDLVLDDASHRWAETTATFATVFPRLRVGGRYVIEDWNHDHILSRVLDATLERNDRASAVLRDRLAEAPVERPPPLSSLVLDLVLFAAEYPDVIDDVVIRSGWAEFRRGPGALPDQPSLPFRTAMGERARAMP